MDDPYLKLATSHFQRQLFRQNRQQRTPASRMTSGHLSQDEVSILHDVLAVKQSNVLTLCAAQFFDKLGHLFNHRKSSDHGAVYLTQKRCKTPPPQPAQLGQQIPSGT